MTCPVSYRPGDTESARAGVSTAPASAPSGSADIADRFERAAGSIFVGLFVAGLFDQAMLPVSAALEDTGRIRNAAWERALRTAPSDQIAFYGDDADRKAEMERLKLHRDVNGVGAEGVRSAR